MSARTESLEIMPCVCGGHVNVYHRSSDLYQCVCIDCGKDGNAAPLSIAIAGWNEMVSKPDSYENIIADMIEAYCRGWCNLYDERCDDPRECRLYGFKKRFANIGKKGGDD